MDAPIFEENGFQNRLELLLSLLGADDRPVVISAEKGSGKSLLLSHVANRSREEFHVTTFQADDPPGGDSLLGAISRRLKGDSESATKELWLIDDADRLPPEVLRPLFALWNKLHASPEPLYLLLCGDDSLGSMLAELSPSGASSEQLRTMELQPLSRGQLEAYVRWRLAQAGGPEWAPSDDEVALIEHHTRGLPGAIEALIQQGKLTTKGLSGLSAPKRWSRLAITLLPLSAIILIALVLLATHLPGDNTPTPAPRETPPPTLDSDLPSTATPPGDSAPVTTAPSRADPTTSATDDDPVPPPPATPQVERSAVNDVDQPAPAIAVPQNATAPQSKGDEAHATALAHTGSATATPTPHDAPIPEVERVEVEAGAETVDIDAETETEAEVEAEVEADAETETDVETEPGTTDESSTGSRVTETIDLETVATTEGGEEPRPSPEPSPEPLGLLTEEEWLAAQPAINHTIQLLGTPNEKRALAWREASTERRHLHPLKTLRNGKPWHIVVYGSFPSAGRATAAIADLPLRHPRYTPWVRSFRSIRGDLERTE